MTQARLSHTIWDKINCKEPLQIFIFIYLYTHADEAGIVELNQVIKKYLVLNGFNLKHWTELERLNLIYRIGDNYIFIPLHFDQNWANIKLAPNSKTFKYLKPLLSDTPYEYLLGEVKMKRALKVFDGIDESDFMILKTPGFKSHAKSMYKTIDVDIELELMHGWYKRQTETEAGKKKMRKRSRWYKFGINWLNKATKEKGTLINKKTH